MSRTVFGFEAVRLSALVSAMALLAGCGGGGGGSTALPSTSSGGTSTSSSGSSSTTLSFTIAAPPTTTSGERRSVQSVSTSINSVAVYAYAAGGSIPTTPMLVGDLSLTPSSGNTSLCVASAGGRLCKITFTAPVGSDIVFINLYDLEPSGGTIPSNANVIASGSAPITIASNGANATTITLNSTAPFGVGVTATLTPTASGSVAPGSVSFALPAGSGSVTANVSEVLQLLLPLSTQRKPQFVAGAGNSEIWSFGLNLTPSTATLPSPGMSLQGTAFVLTGSLVSTFTAAQAGTLSIALYNGSGYTDVGYVTYTFTPSTNTLAITSNTLLLGGETGITQTGIYVVYLPPAGQVIPPPPSASSITVAFSPPTGTSYYSAPLIPAGYTGTNGISGISYLVLGNAAPVKVTVTVRDANNNPISGPIGSSITLTSSDTSGAFTLPATTITSSPTSVTLQYNGTGNCTLINGMTGNTCATYKNNSTIIGGTGVTGSAQISAVCLLPNDDNNLEAYNIDIGEDNQCLSL